MWFKFQCFILAFSLLFLFPVTSTCYFKIKMGASMENSTQSIRALWAIDPTEVRLRPSLEALQNVRHFLGGNFEHVHPTYIYSDDELSKESAQEKVSEFLKPLPLDGILPSDVYLSRSRKRADWAQQILDLAHERQDRIIILTSHGRSTMGNFFLGSFAKEILQKSDLPLLFITHEQPAFAKGEKVLFATDFSDGSEQAFKEFLKFVKGKASEVILCHIINYPLPSYSAAAAGGVVIPLPDYFIAEQKEWASRQVEKWMTEVRKLDMNVHLQSVVEESMSGSSAAIEKVANAERVGVIGLASHVGPIERIALGSVTQDLLASQKYNLWISGPRLGH
jgi:nucleotide-binding universal stress UspA family protein